MTHTVCNTKNVNFKNQPIFFGEKLNIVRDDQLKYPFMKTSEDEMISFFWRPQEVNLLKDKGDFEQKLDDGGKHVFLNNLRYQTLLDSVMQRGPEFTLNMFTSLPEMEKLVRTWSYFEKIHADSYEHIVKNIFPNPSIIFDDIVEHEEIKKRAKSILRVYDDFLNMGLKYLVDPSSVDLYELKKSMYRLIVLINILEGIRFYVSFACNFNFAESLGVMEGSAKILRLICRDENLHMAVTQNLMRIFREGKEGDEWVKISKECEEEAIEMYRECAEQEKDWAKYLFSKGAILGLNAEILGQYVEFLTNKRMKAVGLPTIYDDVKNPLPWMNNWIAGSNVQPAPQETEISSYLGTGGMNMDVNDGDFGDMKL